MLASVLPMASVCFSYEKDSFVQTLIAPFQELVTIYLESVDVFFLFLLVGLLAQIVDGALGMAYGVISSTVLLAVGIPPATASASVHVAEMFTTAASGISHLAHRNVQWSLFFPLAIGGVAGGVAGAYFLTGIDGNQIKPFITAYLGLMGAYIIFRGLRGNVSMKFPVIMGAPLGVVGGFLDAAGGGGWGATVTSTMVGSGIEPRRAIGTVNTAEFLVTGAISGAFLWALLTGRWQEAGDISDHVIAIAGLVIGGLMAAPFAGFLTKKIPAKTLTLMVGGLIMILSGYQLVKLLGYI
jgi:uncharacterized protein